MALEQMLERAHIEEQMKHFKGKIIYLPPGASGRTDSQEYKSYRASTQRGARKAHEARWKNGYTKT